MLRPHVASSMRKVYDQNFHVIGYILENKLDPKEIHEAINALEATMSPPDRRMLVELITEVFTLTKMRGSNQIELDFAVRAYAARLADYPADTVFAVLKDWPNRSKWWPSWCEIKEQLDKTDRKGMMVKALRQANPKGAGKIGALISTSLRRL